MNTKGTHLYFGVSCTSTAKTKAVLFRNDRMTILGFALMRYNIWSARAPKRIPWHNLMSKINWFHDINLFNIWTSRDDIKIMVSYTFCTCVWAGAMIERAVSSEVTFTKCIKIQNYFPLYLKFYYLLTYSMEQSLSWEANWFAASQEIHRILWNPKVHNRTHKRPSTVPILGQPNPVPIPTSHLLEIHPNLYLVNSLAAALREPAL